MKNRLNMLIACLLSIATLALGACSGPKSSVDARAMSNVATPVMDRHDAYVNADESLSEVERSTYLRSTELMRSTLEEALDDSE